VFGKKKSFFVELKFLLSRKRGIYSIYQSHSMNVYGGIAHSTRDIDTKFEDNQ